MNLKSLLLSSDEKTVRVVRRVLGDLEISVDHCPETDEGIRRITRNRYEAIIVDCSEPQTAGDVLRAAKAAPVNKRALSVALVESAVGLKGGFDMGAHFVLHKPLAVERAKSSFRAVRAMMKKERRLQLRVPVQIPVECVGSQRYQAKTLDVCEGGMAIQFKGKKGRETMMRFLLTLPGIERELELWGEMAWEGNTDQVGVRFKNVTEDQRATLRNWLNSQLPEPEADDPPVACRLTELSMGGCYLQTTAPFPKSTRVILSVRMAGLEARNSGTVRIAHPEFGMGVEFLQATTEQQEQARRMFDTLRSCGEATELHVEPDGLEAPPDESLGVIFSTDSLVSFFREQEQLPVEAFMQQMQQQRQLLESH